MNTHKSIKLLNSQLNEFSRLSSESVMSENVSQNFLMKHLIKF